MRDKDYNHLKQWLPPLVKAKGITFERLAQLAGCSRAAVYNWMSDRDRPQEEIMASVCRVLGVPLTEGLSQYTPRPIGRPTTRSRSAKARRTSSQ